MEFFIAWYSGNQYEKFAFYNRIFGPYWWYWWVGMLFCNVLSPQLFWFKWCRRNIYRRLFRLHVRERRHVVRAFHHHRRRIAPRLSPVLVGTVHPDLGRYLDLRRHVRNFHFALPPFHSLPADDRDVGSENRCCRKLIRITRTPRATSSGRGRRKGAHMRTPSGHKVYGMGAEYPSAAALYEAAKTVRDAGFKRWDVHSPFPIHGMDEAMGLGKSWLSAVVLCGGITGLLTAVILEFGPSSVHLSADRARKADQLGDGAGVFPDHVRADGSFLRLRRVFRGADHERPAALVSSDFQLGTIQARDQRRIFPRHRSARPAFYRNRSARASRTKRRPAHHHHSRGVNYAARLLPHFSS